MRRDKICRWLSGAVLAAAMTVAMAIPAFAAGAISSINVTFTSTYELGEIVEPTVSVSPSGVYVESLTWSKDVENWKPGSRVTATLILSCEDGSSFNSSYGEKSCKVRGANLMSARADGENLKVQVHYYPVVQLDSPDDAGWSSFDKTKASWTKAKYATAYQLRLYRDGDYIRTIEATGTSKDLSEYLTKEGYYSYEIRSIAKDSSDAKYMKSSEYMTSSDRVVDNLGDTEGNWRNYSEGSKYMLEDGTYAANTWKLIVGKWYYFNADGYALKGWQLLNDKWYYLGTDGAMLTDWQEINGKWYYFDASGAMATGWCQAAPNQWYYLYPDGSMAANTTIDGKALNASGMWAE